MKLIPTEYQEVEAVYRSIVDRKAKCLCVFSPVGEEGTSSISVCLARRLQTIDKKVLLVDLNSYNPMSFDWIEEQMDDQGWSFDDISCQLYTKPLKQFDFLTVKELKEDAQVREFGILQQAILMLEQEFTYIIFDMPPLMQNNRQNIPLHVISSATDMAILNVALGINNEEQVQVSVDKIKKANFKHIEVVVSQFALPPLGPRLIESVEHRLSRFPWLKVKLITTIKKQKWLFEAV